MVVAGVVLLVPELVVLVVFVLAFDRPVAPPPVGVVGVSVVVFAELLLGSVLDEAEVVSELELEPEVVSELDVVVVFAVVAVDGDALPVVGTVSAGAPLVLPALAPPLPQAASDTATTIAAASASNVREPGSETLCFNPTPNRRGCRLAGNRIHPLPAPRAVEEILL